MLHGAQPHVPLSTHTAENRTSERFPPPENTFGRTKELVEQIERVIEEAVASGAAGMIADTTNVAPVVFVETKSGGDQTKINGTFQKMEGMKKSANAVVSVLKRPSS
jgi:hypothetical protein